MSSFPRVLKANRILRVIENGSKCRFLHFQTKPHSSSVLLSQLHFFETHGTAQDVSSRTSNLACTAKQIQGVRRYHIIPVLVLRGQKSTVHTSSQPMRRSVVKQIRQWPQNFVYLKLVPVCMSVQCALDCRSNWLALERRGDSKILTW